MNLNAWAIKWGVSVEAVEDLRRQMGLINTDPKPYPDESPRSEAANQNLVRLEASRRGARIWRNNNGAFEDERGVWVRYGLCNDSAQMNKAVKSSDLIGIYPVVIKPHHIGHTLGIFLAREIKPQGWHYTGTDREVAQLAFLNLVASLGGNAAFATGEGTL